LRSVRGGGKNNRPLVAVLLTSSRIPLQRFVKHLSGILIFAVGLNFSDCPEVKIQRAIVTPEFDEIPRRRARAISRICGMLVEKSVFTALEGLRRPRTDQGRSRSPRRGKHFVDAGHHRQVAHYTYTSGNPLTAGTDLCCPLTGSRSHTEGPKSKEIHSTADRGGPAKKSQP